MGRKLQFTLASKKDFQAKDEASIPQKRTSSNSKHEISTFFLLLWVIFALLDPDPDSESGSTDLIESGSATLPKTLFRFSMAPSVPAVVFRGGFLPLPLVVRHRGEENVHHQFLNKTTGTFRLGVSVVDPHHNDPDPDFYMIQIWIRIFI